MGLKKMKALNADDKPCVIQKMEICFWKNGKHFQEKIFLLVFLPFPTVFSNVVSVVKT